MALDPTRRRHLLILIAVVVVILFVLQRLQHGGQFDRCIEFFRALGPAPYFLAMAVLPVFGFPIGLFTLAAGPVFGPTLGVGPVIAWAILAEMANMSVCYWLSGYALRARAVRLVARLGYKLPELAGGSSWEITLLVRLVPGLPFFVQNYLLGIARVPFGTYLLVSTAVHALLVVAAILAGDAFETHDPRALVAGLVVFVIAAIAIVRLRRRWVRVPPAPVERG